VKKTTPFKHVSVNSAPAQASATAVVEVPVVEEPKPAAEQQSSEVKRITSPTGSAIRDIWDRNKAAQREATEPTDVYEESDSEIDIPAFLREHRRNRDK
jgi:hypothetical protein